MMLCVIDGVIALFKVIQSCSFWFRSKTYAIFY